MTTTLAPPIVAAPVAAQAENMAAAYVFNWSSRFGYQSIKLPAVTRSKSDGVLAAALRENGGETRDSIRIYEALSVPVELVQEYLPEYLPKKRTDTHINIGTKWARMIVQSAIQRELRDKYLKSLGLEGWMFAAADMTDICTALDDVRSLITQLLCLLRDERVYSNARGVYERRLKQIFRAAGVADETELAQCKSYFPPKQALVTGTAFNLTTTVPRPLSAETVALRQITRFAGTEQQQAAMNQLLDAGAHSLRQAAEAARISMVDEMMGLVVDQLDKLDAVEGKTLTSAARAKLDEQAVRVQSLLNMLEALDVDDFSGIAQAVQDVNREVKTGHTVALGDRLTRIRAKLAGDLEPQQLSGTGHRATGQWAML